MACPYFHPTSPQVATAGPQNSMLPLGDAWAGICQAVPSNPWEPDRTTLHPLCNLGYARGACTHFPSSAAAPDAVRFTVSADDDGDVLLYYVVERDHHPFAHGPLRYSIASRGFTARPQDSVLESQALAYIASYLRRKAEANTR